MLSSMYLPARTAVAPVSSVIDVEVVQPGGAADLAEDARTAATGELGRGGRELGELEGGEVLRSPG